MRGVARAAAVTAVAMGVVAGEELVEERVGTFRVSSWLVASSLATSAALTAACSASSCRSATCALRCASASSRACTPCWDLEPLHLHLGALLVHRGLREGRLMLREGRGRGSNAVRDLLQPGHLLHEA